MLRASLTIALLPFFWGNLLTGALAKCVPESDCAAIRTTVKGFIQANPGYINLGVESCKSDILDWVLGMTDFLPYADAHLGKALLKLTRVVDNNVVLNGEEMLGLMAEPGIKATLAFCVPLCKLLKKGCGCEPEVDSNLFNLVGGDSRLANEVIKQGTKLCMEDFSGTLDFTYRLISDGTCSTIPSEAAAGWKC